MYCENWKSEGFLPAAAESRMDWMYTDDASSPVDDASIQVNPRNTITSPATQHVPLIIFALCTTASTYDRIVVKKVSIYLTSHCSKAHGDDPNQQE